jgi:hypothetical protein
VLASDFPALSVSHHGLLIVNRILSNGAQYANIITYIRVKSKAGG